MAHTSERIHTVDAAQQPGFRRISTNRKWLESVGWRIDSEIRHHENFVVAIAIAIVTLFSLLFSLRKPFDVDEYLVQITARAESSAAIWRLLKTAPLSVDPPLYHFLVHCFLRILGPTEFVERLPSVLAYTSMTFFLYRVVRRYTDIYTGLIVLALSLQCGAFAFAYYARPYALLLAADAMALLCWVIAIEKQRPRNIALLGIFFGIAIAVGSHWFGFLVLIPLIVGEVVRTWQRHKLDLPVCIAITGGAATAMAYLPLLRAAVAYRAMPWKGVAINDIAATYQLILEPCLVPLLLLVIVAFARAMFTAPRPESSGPALPIPVFACVAAFALTPFAGFILAKIVTHAFQPRYTLLCSIGVLLLVALAVREGMAARVPWMAFAALTLVGLISFVQYHSFLKLPSGGDTAALADVSLFSTNGSLPVVPGSDGLFLRIEAHAPASLRQRCVFPTDHDFIRLTHNNTNFLMTEGFRRWTNLPVVDLSTFLSAHPQFYFIRNNEQDWMMQRMIEDHAQIMLQGTYEGHPVYLINLHP
jgi:uncharacterized membrane protein